VDPKRPKLSFAILTDADDLAALYTSGLWSSMGTEKSVFYEVRRPKFVKFLVARRGATIVGKLRLATKKPWAIDTSYFSPVERPLYLTSMAVAPDMQRHGIGRLLLQEAANVARAWPGDAIRLDALAGDAGAGPFYAKSGYREVGRVTYKTSRLVYFELLLLK
jgi:GNAT superfamily N-acetyltransferase